MFLIMRRKSLTSYINQIQRPIDKFKKLDIKKYDIRNDYKQVLVLQHYDKNEMINIINKEYANCELELNETLRHEKNMKVIKDTKLALKK